MLVKPDIEDEKIIAALHDAYGLEVVALDFLPLGVDHNAAAYRAETADGRSTFVKLRRGALNETPLALARFLSQRGISAVIPPLETRQGALWASLDPLRLVVYPYIQGQDGYQVELSERQWLDFGRAVKAVHATDLPTSLGGRIRRETYSLHWCQVLRRLLDQTAGPAPADPLSAESVRFLKAQTGPIEDLLQRTERLADRLQDRALPPVLCHSDLHAGNGLIAADGTLYLVDWDEPILAPKERDLMFVGGGLWGGWRTPQEEEDLFYRGYGRAEIDPWALAYYRYARIVEDIAVFGQQILLADKAPPDRAQSLRYLKSNFEFNGTIAIACERDSTDVV